MTPAHPHGSAPPLAPARPGKCVAAQAGAPISGVSSSLAAASPDTATHGTAVRANHTECAGVRAHSLSALPETTPASLDASISDAGALFEQTQIARIERLILLTDAHKARRRHASVKGIMRRLRDVTARLAGQGV